MLQSFLNLTPIFLFFGLGIFLKSIRFAEIEQARFLLKIVLFVTLPALILMIVSELPLTVDKLTLPFANIGINLGCMCVTYFVARFMSIDTKTIGSMLVSTMIINNLFMYPFVLLGLGEEAFADAVLFDFGNMLTTSTVTYAIAFRHGDHGANLRDMLIKVLSSPLVWAIAVALCINILSIKLPVVVIDFLDALGQMTVPLTLIALGLFFTPKLGNLKIVSTIIFIRMGCGLAIGLLLTQLLGFEGTTFIVVALCSAAPIGFNALTFSYIARLNMDIASSAVSISTILRMIYIPILLFIFTLS